LSHHNPAFWASRVWMSWDWTAFSTNSH